MLIEEVNKSTGNKYTRNKNATNIYLVLASLGKFNKVKCPSFTKQKQQKKHFIGAILNKVLTAIPGAESTAQRCLGGEGHVLTCPY